MRGHDDLTWLRMGRIMLRSVVVGAASGVIGGALIFFLFGFIGFAGAPITSRIANGWRALLDPGIEKGLAVGAGIAIGLMGVIAIWTVLIRRFDPHSARPWLASLAGAVVVLFNLETFYNSGGSWDAAGIATVVGIAALVATTVWLISPWVLRDWPVVRGRKGADRPSGGLRSGEQGKGDPTRTRRTS